MRKYIERILGNDVVKDSKGKIISVGDIIEDENGNKGKIKSITQQGDLIVNFGKDIGIDVVRSNDRFAKGRW